MTKEHIELELGKKMVFVMLFRSEKHDSDEHAFSAYHKAEKFCKDHGLDIGSMERDYPIGVAKNCDISKWTNLRNHLFNDRPLLDGALVSKRFRYQDVVLYLSYDPTKVAKSG